jgi:hypothetical protein
VLARRDEIAYRSGLAADVVFRVIHAVGAPAFGVPAVR